MVLPVRNRQSMPPVIQTTKKRNSSLGSMKDEQLDIANEFKQVCQEASSSMKKHQLRVYMLRHLSRSINRQQLPFQINHRHIFQTSSQLDHSSTVPQTSRINSSMIIREEQTSPDY